MIISLFYNTLFTKFWTISPQLLTYPRTEYYDSYLSKIKLKVLKFFKIYFIY